MKRFMSLGFIAALLMGTFSPLALAADEHVPGVLHIEDKASVFTSEGVKKAEASFHDVSFKTKTNWTIVTVGTIPASKKAEAEAAKNAKEKADKARLSNEFFGEWAKELARDRGSKADVMTLIYLEGDSFYVKVVTTKNTDLQRHFSDKDCDALANKFLVAFREVKDKKLTGTEAQEVRTTALQNGTDFVISQLKDTTIRTKTHDVKSEEKKAGGMSIGGLICIGLCVLLGVWFVIGLIRMMTGGGGGGGYGGGGYGGGGGGGGFLTSMIGGMFGAAAGMWMYNHFMGGNSVSDLSAGQSGGDYGGGNDYDNSGNDYDGGASGGGGDYGDSGGDTGGGGGDWGDTGGGGGDFGGGGGDFGGGGGDW